MRVPFQLPALVWRMAVLWLGLAVPGIGMAQTAALPSFEVATIKPSKADDAERGIMSEPGGRFSTSKTTLKDLIEYAYSIVSDDQLMGISDWMASERYDIRAKMPAAMAAAQPSPDGKTNPTRLMLRALLRDRFHLQVSSTKRPVSVYGLAVAKQGARLKSSEMKPAGSDGMDIPHPAKGSYFQVRGQGRLVAYGFTMAQTADLLSRQGDISPQGSGRIVLDETGLKGMYDWTLVWTPLQADPQAGAAADPNGPSLFSALRDQLGLKLEPKKEMLDVLVVDHAERPTEN